MTGCLPGRPREVTRNDTGAHHGRPGPTPQRKSAVRLAGGGGRPCTPPPLPAGSGGQNRGPAREDERTRCFRGLCWPLESNLRNPRNEALKRNAVFVTGRFPVQDRMVIRINEYWSLSRSFKNSLRTICLCSGSHLLGTVQRFIFNTDHWPGQL